MSQFVFIIFINNTLLYVKSVLNICSKWFYMVVERAQPYISLSVSLHLKYRWVLKVWLRLRRCQRLLQHVWQRHSLEADYSCCRNLHLLHQHFLIILSRILRTDLCFSGLWMHPVSSPLSWMWSKHGTIQKSWIPWWTFDDTNCMTSLVSWLWWFLQILFSFTYFCNLTLHRICGSWMLYNAFQQSNWKVSLWHH